MLNHPNEIELCIPLEWGRNCASFWGGCKVIIQLLSNQSGMFIVTRKKTIFSDRHSVPTIFSKRHMVLSVGFLYVFCRCLLSLSFKMWDTFLPTTVFQTYLCNFDTLTLKFVTLLHTFWVERYCYKLQRWHTKEWSPAVVSNAGNNGGLWGPEGRKQKASRDLRVQQNPRQCYHQ